MARQSEALGGPETTRINERIRANEVRLIGAEGEQLGVVSSDEARTIADDNGLDLVEVAPNAKPPVCRVMDYGKYKYEEKKKKAAGKAKSHSTSLKEVKLRPGTDEHDLDFKLRNARRFLMDGDKVKVTVMFRGREMVHRENGYNQLDKVKEVLGDLATMENAPRMEGRFLSTILVANREAIAKAKRADEEKAAEEVAKEEGAVEAQ
jgi:translation initiation factor IF-3